MEVPYVPCLSLVLTMAALRMAILTTVVLIRTLLKEELPLLELRRLEGL